MAWDISEPQDTTKIRDLGTVIRPNWVAIDQAESTFTPIAFNFANRTPDPAANDPAAIADTYILYCKDDSGGDPELFGIDESSNIIQFTNGAPTAANPGSVFLPGGLIMKWGSATVGSGVTAIAYSSAFPNNVYSIVLQSINTATSTYSYGANALVGITLNASAALTYHYIAIGD